MKTIVAIAVFVITISFLWFHNSSSPTTATPTTQGRGAANLFLQSGEDVPTATFSSTPTALPATPTPAPTPTQLIPQAIIPPATAIPSPKPTLPVGSPTASVGATTSTPTLRPTPTLTPASTPTTAPTPELTFIITSLTNPVAQKQDASIAISTKPGAACTIEVTWPSGSISTSKDLAPKSANAEGIASWSWGVNWNTKPGTAIIKLSCASDGQTYSGQTTMQIIPSQ